MGVSVRTTGRVAVYVEVEVAVDGIVVAVEVKVDVAVGGSTPVEVLVGDNDGVNVRVTVLVRTGV